MKTTIKNNIIHIRFENRYEMTSTMVRMQEFYESPFPEINGKYFTLDNFMDVYVEHSKDNEFTYFTDWEGFNLPGKVVNKFLRMYIFKLREKEVKLFREIPLSMLLGFRKFYLIATFNDDSLVHEIAHALYDLNLEYHDDMLTQIHLLSAKKLAWWYNKLEKQGYCKEVFNDEIQAYSIDKGVKKFKEIYNHYLK
jgi:hypothetical protein